ncbi:MAG TPA: glycerophosphoryl diester phosphodiesterase membrane domain-containing protein [Allosphingosinicella sp.]|jgi:hypothetical protein
MAGLSMNEAWNDAAGFAQRHFGTLFTIAAALIVLPSVVVQAIAPTPGEGGGSLLPFLLSLIALAFNLAGSLAISALAVGRETVVGAGIGRAFRRLPVMAVLAALAIIGAVIILLPIVAASGLQPEHLLAPEPSPDTQRRVALVTGLFALVALPIAARLVPITPVIAAEDLGPLRSIRRSWRLSAGHFWKLLAFTFLMGLLTMVVMLAARLVFGLAIAFVAGPIEHGSLGAVIHLLLTSLATAAIGVFVTCLVARIYVQLSGPPAEPAKGI